MDEELRDLERRSLAGDPDAEAKLRQQLVRRHELLARYVGGEHEQVWAELTALGPAVRDPRWLEAARGVARETMRRARKNVATLHGRLLAAGYRFQHPERAHAPQPPDVEARLDALEALLGGPLPLSLRAFYELVGSVSFAQSPHQTQHDLGASDLQRLGTDDPLWVAPLAELEAAVREGRPDGNPRALTGAYEADPLGPHERDRVYFRFAPDLFHKAGVSGGEDYHVWLPDRRADFRIVGLDADEDTGESFHLGGEWFVANLRATLLGGGFRGRLADPDREEPGGIDPRLPPRPLARRLADGLLPL